jgi:Helix-turn-helix domain
MAINVMQWVWDKSRSRLSARLVLLAIADNASSDGGQAWPSINELARKARISVTSVHDAIRSLVELGELEVLVGGGKTGRYGTTNSYRVIMLDYPDPKVTQRDTRPPAPRTDSRGGRSSEGAEVRTPEDFAPVRNSSEGTAEGVRETEMRGTDSVQGTVLEPPVNPEPSLPAPAGAGPATGAAVVDLFGDRPPAPPVRPAPVPAANVGRIVKAWIDSVQERTGQQPLRRTIGQISSHLGGLAREGVPAELLREGLADWQQRIYEGRGLDPVKVADLVNEAAGRARGAPPGSQRGSRGGQAAPMLTKEAMFG